MILHSGYGGYPEAGPGIVPGKWAPRRGASRALVLEHVLQCDNSKIVQIEVLTQEVTSEMRLANYNFFTRYLVDLAPAA